MSIDVKNHESQFLGELEPLLHGHAKAAMDRRQISFRWLGGSILTGLASVFLMGGALFAALDGRQQLSIPAQAYQTEGDTQASQTHAIKGERPSLAFRQPQSQSAAANKIMMVSTIAKEGDQNVVKLKPFMHVASHIAIAPKSATRYPNFDALAIFSESGKAEPITTASDLIYGANVDGEISLKTEDYPFGDGNIYLGSLKTSHDVEEIVRNTAPNLNIGVTALASLTYFDPARFSSSDSTFISTPGLTITAENVSVISSVTPHDYGGTQYTERFATIRSDSPIALVLEGEGLNEADALRLSDILASDLGSPSFSSDDNLGMFFKNTPDGQEQLVRISVYRSGAHIVSVARKSNSDFVYAQKPELAPELSIPSQKKPHRAISKLPSIYNGIYRAALNEGLTVDLASKLIRVFAFDVDFNIAIKPTDFLSVFLSLENDQKQATDDSKILMAAIRLGETEHRYYRFFDEETETVDYYDETGKSAKKFLLRQPVPNGRFRSPFGMRRHPVTRVMKMHTGVDWSAPRGTPILAAGNGTIKKAGWSGGYGRQTVLRHANGYTTTYSHQTAFAKGIKEGARVRQGQVIGYVGSTGLSTGPHLHYEVHVNSNKVNPMRIKLPKGKVFRGEQLRDFEAERDRINALIKAREEENLQLAIN